MTEIQLYDMMPCRWATASFTLRFCQGVGVGAQARRRSAPVGDRDGRTRSVILDERTLERVAANLPKRKQARPRGPDFVPRSGNLGKQHQQFAFFREIAGGWDGGDLRQAPCPTVLELAAAESPSSSFVLADLVLAEDSIVLDESLTVRSKFLSRCSRSPRTTSRSIWWI